MSLQPTPLASLANVCSGGGAPQKADSFSDIGYPFVRAGSLAKLLNGAGETDLEKLEPDVAAEHGLKLFPSGTVLFAKSGMSATKGHVYRLQGPAYVVNHLAALVPHHPSDSAFLARALQKFSPTTLIKDQAYPSIRLGDIEQMTVLAPRSAEERARIASILDQADAVRQKRYETVRKLGDLGFSIFREMFDLTNLPRRELSDLVDIETGLIDPTDDNFADLPHIGPEHIVGHTGEILQFRTARQDGVRSGKFLFDEECVLYSKIRPNLNKVALAPIKGVCSADMYPIRPKPGVANREFVWFLLRSKDFLAHASSFSNRANIPKLNRSQLLNYRAPAPSIEDQDEFAVRYMQVANFEKCLKSQLAQLNIFFMSLQHHAFRGDI